MDGGQNVSTQLIVSANVLSIFHTDNCRRDNYSREELCAYMGTTPPPKKQFLGGSQTVLLHKERSFRGGRPPLDPPRQSMVVPVIIQLRQNSLDTLLGNYFVRAKRS